MGIQAAFLKRIIKQKAQAQTARQPTPRPSGRAPALDITGIYESFIYHHDNAVDETRLQGGFHPSSGLSHGMSHCYRNIMFDLARAPRSPQKKPPALCKILSNGTHRHQSLNASFKKLADSGFMGIVGFEHDVFVQHPTLPLFGEMDGVLTTKSGHQYVIDFKTINDKNFKATTEIGLKYKLQLNTYMGLSGIHAGYVLYENKNSQTWNRPLDPHFRHDFDADMFRETEEFCVDVLRDLVAGDIPVYEEEACEQHVTFCSYTEVCEKHRRKLIPFPDYRTAEDKRLHLKVIQ
jgi:hypothetical protein